MTVGGGGAAGRDGGSLVSKREAARPSHVRHRKNCLCQLLVVGVCRVLLDKLRKRNGVVDLHAHVPQRQVFPQLAVHKLSTRFIFTLS